MLRDELHSNLDNQGFFEKYFGLGIKTFVIALVSVIAIGMYISVLLFGDNSLEVLMRLDEYKSYLSDEIDSVKKENASLQKEFFELKELETN